MSNNIDYRDLFLTDKTVIDHIAAYDGNIEMYMSTYMLLMNSDVHLHHTVKENVLGALVIAKDENAIKFLFSKPFWTILDIRNVKRLLWDDPKGKHKPKENKPLRSLMSNGRMIDKPRREMLMDCIRRMDIHQIERSIFRHSYDAWREVIDFFHMKEADFPDCCVTIEDYWAREKDATGQLHAGHSQLQKCIMDGTWEPTNYIKMMRSLNQENAAGILSDMPYEFHYVRSKIQITEEIALAYVEAASPANLVRWYKELAVTPKVAQTIADRLVIYEKMIHHPYSRYFQLLLDEPTMFPSMYDNLIERADKLIDRFIVPYQKKALIAVDKSSSMDQEMVRIGTAVAALIGKQLEADLVYFWGDPWGNNQQATYELTPTGTQHALKLVYEHTPTGSTPIAQIMLPYLPPAGAAGYEGRNDVDLQTIVFVTDEGENVPWNGMTIVQALVKYREKVGHNLDILIIRIGSLDKENGGRYGDMYDRFIEEGFNTTRYVLESMNHLESMFALIEANTPLFLQDQTRLAELLVSTAGPDSYYYADKNLRKYKKVRDDIFASVIKGTCANCSANLEIEQVTKFRFGAAIRCSACDFVLAPTLFGEHKID